MAELSDKFHELNKCYRQMSDGKILDEIAKKELVVRKSEQGLWVVENAYIAPGTGVHRTTVYGSGDTMREAILEFKIRELESTVGDYEKEPEVDTHTASESDECDAEVFLKGIEKAVRDVHYDSNRIK